MVKNIKWKIPELNESSTITLNYTLLRAAWRNLVPLCLGHESSLVQRTPSVHALICLSVAYGLSDQLCKCCVACIHPTLSEPNTASWCRHHSSHFTSICMHCIILYHHNYSSKHSMRHRSHLCSFYCSVLLSLVWFYLLLLLISYCISFAS